MSPGSPRTLTTSPQMALFHRFLARWSAFWVPRPSGRLLDGGNCTTRGCDTPATHRQRASCSAKPPPPPSWSAPAGPEGPAPVPMSGKSPATGPKGGPLPVQNSPSTPPRTACAVQNSPSTSRTAPLPVQNSPRTSRAAPLPVQNSPSSPEMARFGTFSTCRESFIPLPPPRSRAGRILYRTRGRDGARQHNSTPGHTGAEGTGGSGGSGCPEGLAAALESDGDNHPSKSRT